MTGSARGTATVGESVELAVVTRNGFVESRHAGSAVVLAPDGEPLVTLGTPDARILTRSAMKPLQSLAMHSGGLQLDADDERAISLASHSGTDAHVEIVRRVLARGGLSEDQLQCPADWPLSDRAKLDLARSGGEPSAVRHCCSGKHAAMLRTCVAAGWPTDEYLAPGHPLQQLIRDTVQRFTGESPDPARIDGCGAPTYAISLTGLARAIRRMAVSEATSPFPLQRQAAALLTAARAHGWVVGGHGAGDTVLIDKLGVFSKFGAEGTVVVATPTGHVVAVTMLDGSTRAVHAVAAELLVQVGVITRESFNEAARSLRLAVFGGGKTVGAVLPSPSLGVSR